MIFFWKIYLVSSFFYHFYLLKIKFLFNLIFFGKHRDKSGFSDPDRVGIGMTHSGYVGLEKIGLIPIRDEKNRGGSGRPNADP